MKPRLSIAMSLILGALCHPALAAPETQRVDVRLSFPADATAEEMYEEIKRTSARACRTNPVHAHGRLARERACREEFVARAVVVVNREALTALHLELTAQTMADLAEASGAQGPWAGDDQEKP